MLPSVLEENNGGCGSGPVAACWPQNCQVMGSNIVEF